ncbi:hypothetical protein RRG08_064118 [Elysia crispata]|uniref:Uncharacterized protein n=1 Tax=Elysia crispata TaxID=231223 RepID=A0AAE0ZP15_9GAST|nr:hypothetical protein RRG08_064118 [Elysia crispata]
MNYLERNGSGSLNFFVAQVLYWQSQWSKILAKVMVWSSVQDITDRFTAVRSILTARVFPPRDGFRGSECRAQLFPTGWEEGGNSLVTGRYKSASDWARIPRDTGSNSVCLKV